jgi:hypothetical protein
MLPRGFGHGEQELRAGPLFHRQPRLVIHSANVAVSIRCAPGKSSDTWNLIQNSFGEPGSISEKEVIST